MFDQVTTFMFNHWMLCAAFVAVLALILLNERNAKKGRAHEISPAKAVDLLNHSEAVVLDLRDTEAFRGGHIVNALQAKAEDFETPRMEKYKQKPVILVCPRGIQASLLAKRLAQQGFTHAVSLAGGLSAWQAASLPLVKGK